MQGSWRDTLNFGSHPRIHRTTHRRIILFIQFCTWKYGDLCRTAERWNNSIRKFYGNRNFGHLSIASYLEFISRCGQWKLCKKKQTTNFKNKTRKQEQDKNWDGGTAERLQFLRQQLNYLHSKHKQNLEIWDKISNLIVGERLDYHICWDSSYG